MRLDEKDLHLIDILKAEGKRSIQALSERIHLSMSATSRRVQRLEDQGVIQGYKADINAHKLGLRLTVFVEIALRQQTDEAFDQFEAAIKSHPAIQSCHLMTGEFDYLIQVLVKDAEGFEQLHRKTLARLPYVDRIKSAFAIRNVKS